MEGNDDSRREFIVPFTHLVDAFIIYIIKFIGNSFVWKLKLDELIVESNENISQVSISIIGHRSIPTLNDNTAMGWAQSGMERHKGLRSFSIQFK